MINQFSSMRAAHKQVLRFAIAATTAALLSGCGGGLTADGATETPSMVGALPISAAAAATNPGATRPPAAAARSITLSWEPPTTNVDGSPVRDLTGYRILYGNVSGAYTQIVNVVDPLADGYKLDGLAAGTYYLVVRALGNGVESDLSAEVSKTLQ